MNIYSNKLLAPANLFKICFKVRDFKENSNFAEISANPFPFNNHYLETHMYLNAQTQYYNNQLHVGSIIPLKSIII
jgi:hypothetical protein